MLEDNKQQESKIPILYSGGKDSEVRLLNFQLCKNKETPNKFKVELRSKWKSTKLISLCSYSNLDSSQIQVSLG